MVLLVSCYLLSCLEVPELSFAFGRLASTPLYPLAWFGFCPVSVFLCWTLVSGSPPPLCRFWLSIKAGPDGLWSKKNYIFRVSTNQNRFIQIYSTKVSYVPNIDRLSRSWTMFTIACHWYTLRMVLGSQFRTKFSLSRSSILKPKYSNQADPIVSRSQPTTDPPVLLMNSSAIQNDR